MCLADECGGRCHINLEQLNKYHGIQISLFLPVASCRPNMRVSGCCLRVSGWCLGVSGRCLRCVDVISTEKSSITVIQFIYTRPFLPVPVFDKNEQKRDN